MILVRAVLVAFVLIITIRTNGFCQKVEVHEGNIFFIAPDGASKQLTSSGLDSQPMLSLSGRRVVFVRDTPDLKIQTGIPGPGDTCCHTNNELWIADVAGTKQPRRILRGHSGRFQIDSELVLADFNSPQFSLDGTLVFFEANTWATDVGFQPQRIPSGKYKGYFIGYKNMPNYPTHIHLYWLLDQMSYQCRECEAIALEINDAFREAWASKDQPFRDACLAAYSLLRGTEADLERAQELLPKFKPNLDLLPTSKPNLDLSRAGHAVRKKLAHEALTGHRIRLKIDPGSL